MAKNAKKGTYTFKELGEIVMKKYPGKFVHLESASVQCAHVAQRLGIDDINGKKKYKQIAAGDAEKILEDMRQSYENHPRTHSTPLERMAKQDEATEFLKNLVEPQAVTSKQIDPIELEEELKAFTEHSMAKYLKAKDPEEEPKKVDDFEVRRKRFYTDANYFLNRAQTPGERVAIWSALSHLYGIGGNISWDLTNPDPNKAVTMKPETAEQRDKWSI